MKKIIFLIISHAVAITLGFALGLFSLPLLTQAEPPRQETLAAAASQRLYEGFFSKDRIGSDFLHQGEGTISLGNKMIAFEGKLSPGPDYKLYLSPVFVETKADFLQQKAKMIKLADVKNFNNFVVAVPKGVDIKQYNTVIIWCESFQQYITSASYSLVKDE